MFFIPMRYLKPLYTGDAGAGGGAGGEGGAGGAGSGGTGTGNDPAKNGGASDAKFTQADLDRLIGERLTRAEESTLKKVFEGLGVKDIDEAKARFKKAEDLENEKLSEVEKAKKSAADAQAEIERIKTESATKEAAANTKLMKAAVMGFAANFHDPNDAWLYVDKEKLSIDDKTGDVKGAKELVEALAKAKPHLVKSGPGGKGTPASKGGGTGKEGELPPLKITL